mmetsp:Transcript_123769/g.309413  ORF Transcript_123769/g.309413 Transcript_123769/m.309413 type:complete len:811 (-) Transcript_123769:227-2659(-)
MACQDATTTRPDQISEKTLPGDIAAQYQRHVAARGALPSRYTEKGGDVWVWLKEKAQHESRLGQSDGDLWMVHGKWYDLSGFVDKHPGGADWLRLTRGQDITEAFEVHHINMPKAEAILKTTYIKDADPGYVSRYAWDDNGFYRTLKRRVREVIGTLPDGRPDTGPTQYFIGLCCFAVAVHFASFGALLCCGHWFLAVLAGFTLQAFHGIGHNALHMKDNLWMYCYDFCGWKHHKHRVSHALSHHLHPNTAIDLEFPEPWSYTSTAVAHHNSRWVVLLGPLGMYSGPLRDIFSLWRGLCTGSEPWRPEYVFNMLQLMSLVLASGPVAGLLHFCIMHFICGFCIETAGFALHRSIFCWSFGDEHAKYDYGEHCLASTADHDIDMPLLPSLYLFQILNNHGIHHLFPTIDKSRILEIMPIFRETCREFGLPWQEYDWRDMFGALWKNWVKGLYKDTPAISTPPSGHPPVPGSKLRVTPISGQTFGAVVSGVQISSLSEDELRVIRRAWNQHGVLIFKDQDIEPEHQVAFNMKFPHSKTCDKMRFCGPLAKDGFDADEWRKWKLPAQSEIQLRGHGELKDHYGVSGFLDTGKGAREFHSDSLHEYDTPPVFTSLYCYASPGNDETLFIDTAHAYDLLSEAEQERVDSLFVQYKREPSTLHATGLKADFGAGLDTLGKLYSSAVENAQSGEVAVSEVHPLVWTHPSTGRKAIVAAAMWMYRIVESDGTPWTPEESHEFVYKLLKPVYDQLYAHRWCPKDLVCFDNRRLMHSASKAPSGFRLLHQVILCGDRVPVGPAGTGVGNPVVNPNVAAAR